MIKNNGIESALNGVCSCCGRESKKWTNEEIDECIEYFSIDREDFRDTCSTCFNAMYGVNISGRLQ